MKYLVRSIESSGILLTKALFKYEFCYTSIFTIFFLTLCITLTIFIYFYSVCICSSCTKLFGFDSYILFCIFQGLHPRLITEGFDLAKAKALEVRC